MVPAMQYRKRSGILAVATVATVAAVAAIAAVAFALSTPAFAGQKVDQMTVEAGGQLVAELCSGCHATRKAQSSPHGQAPSLRRISRNYPVEGLAEALAEGLMVGHPDMPVFEFEVEQIDQIIAYLNSIQDQ